ncbi:Arabinose efflux permease [Caballeronia glathei]|uniref:Arabinose transporter permease n=1 Tax=Caballeronia glathei TaxID=60547 RepID=A0A069PKZ4_9BURK|nr:MFS transporter [Caballeronia glathei]KDR40589.1 arabinose transporter permease [Caballeronia glathei]CDY74584.1 Arabinose efflux permease [Caballeronia glathei]
MPIPLIALAISAFAIGTTEFVIMGLLPNVARDLAVSIPSAGLLVTGYALGVAVGAPLLAVLTSRMPRKLALQLLMAVFIVGNVLCAIAPNYGLLMFARVVTSFAHGSFFGIGAVVVASLVPAEKRASAIALMFTGLTLANVLGVPFGTFIGQQFGWRATFWIVAALGVLSALGVTALVPNRHDAGPSGLGREVRVLKDPQVWLALSMTVLGFGGVFVVFTYIAPILEQVGGFSPHGVTLVLVLFGVGLTIGNMIGGRLADRALMPSLMGILIALALVMAVFATTSHSQIGTVVTIFFWGIAAFATVPPLQTRVVEKAKDAPNLASTLNIGAFNVGNALGAWLGGAVLAHGRPLDTLPWVAAAVTIGALAVTWYAGRLDARQPAGGVKPADA